MSDVLTVMFHELRTQRPSIWQGDEWAQWEAAIGQTITAMPTQIERWFATKEIMFDLLLAFPTLERHEAHRYVSQLVLLSGGKVET